MVEYDSIEVPCAVDAEHEPHWAYIRKELGGKAVLEVVDLAQTSEVDAGMRAIFRALVDWDLHDAAGEKLPLTQVSVDDLHLQQIQALRTPAIKAFHEGNKPLPNASGGRSPSTSSGSRSRRQSKKA